MANNSTFTINIKALFDASDVKTKVGDIEKAFNNIKLSDGLKRNLTSSFNDLNKALDTFQAKAQKGITSKADTKGLNTSLNNVINGFQKLEHVVDKVKAEVGDSVDLSKIIKLDDNTANKLKSLQADIKNLKQELSNTNADSLNELNNVLNQIKSTTKAFSQGKHAIELFKKGDIQEAIAELDKIIAKQKTMWAIAQNPAAKNTYDNNIAQLNELRNIMNQAQSDTSNITSQINQKMGEVSSTSSKAFGDLVKGINDSSKSLAQFRQNAENVATPLNNAATNQLRLNTELDQLKSRIQYFIGLSNAVNLFKRGVQSAFNTVKELDAAMTETAVVTDFSVADMWAQLPDYTKRANDLGVTTKAAYEAATLYYQQGLKTNEVTAMSNETLKMARIAGLDAAVATDRMTNAIRGFNMEINETNAQRIDDVYSKLAAISASNVDEISTAMTKVASLANSANMEFETTSAFLAQIIETTRESAETAGTALKTVVARFSEVKKLVSEDQLKGQDEEGQLIDVNKVSEALRTAGVDLNKYFLGEVGLDDIFMELASKWDSLTTLQQRYIATQAAGSRQQSRFIALMSDYGRMQELVGEAYNANGAAAEQFGKTQDSLQSKLARLKNAWDEFAMGITNNSVIKGAVSLLTLLLNIVNKVTGAFGEGVGSVLKFGAAIGTLAGVKKLFKAGGLAEKGLAAFGNSKIGQFFGLGGSETAVAGASFKAQVVSAGAEFAAAVRGAAAANAASVNTPGTVAASGTTSLLDRIRNFKANSMAPGWYLDPQYQSARNKYYNLRATQPYNLEAIAQARREIASTGAAARAAATPTTLFGALGNRFVDKTSVGKKLSTGLGKVLGLEGAASGAATLAMALGSVAAVAGVATIAVKKLYDASPAGQVKIAEKYADNIKRISDETKKTTASLKEAQTKYKEYNQAISNSTDVQGYSKAVQDRNEYLTSLLEQDASFAKYIQSEVKNGELVLSIDEEAFANAITKAEENAQNLKVDNLLAQANLSSQRADFVQQQIDIFDKFGALTDSEKAKKAQYEIQQQSLIAESQAFATQAAQELLSDFNIGDELINNIASSYGKIFDNNEFQKEFSYSGFSGFISSVFKDVAGSLGSEYELYYGTDSAKGLTRNEKVAGIRAEERRQEYKQGLSSIADAITKDTSGQVEKLFKAMSGDIDLSDEELESPKLEAALEKLVTALGKDFEQTKTQIKQVQEQRRELKQAKATNIYSQALQSGKAITPEYRDLIDTLDFDRITGISNILDSVKGKINEDLFSSLFDSLPEMGESTFAEFSDFFKSFNLDTPIQAFKQLQDAKEKALEGSEFSKVLNSLEEVNAATFETSNLFKSFYQSDAYDSISDSLADFVEENGKISGENIEELAASCSDLDVLLNDTSLTAEGLARALNSLSDGTLSIDSLTNSVLAAISVGQDYESLLNEIHKTISDFDPGLDTGEGSDFIVEQAKNLNELVEGYEFGNEQTKNIYNKLFGEDAYQSFMSDWGERGVDEFATEAQNRIQQLSDWAENNSYGFMKQFAGDQYGLGITQTGDYDFDWDISQFESTDAVLQKIMETANVSRSTAEMLFSGFAAQSYDLQEAWNQLDYKTKLDAFAKDVQNRTFITKEELDALGKATGKTTEEVLQNLQKLGGEKGINIPVVVELKDKNGNDLTDGALKGAFKKAFRTDEKSFKDVARNYAKQFEVALEDGSKGINADALFQNLTSQGFSPEQASELADNIVKTTEAQLLTKTIKIPKIEKGKDGAITVTSEDVVITADSMSGLTAAENAAMEAANYDIVAQKITEGDFSGITDSIKSAVETAVNEAGGKLSSIANNFNGSSITSKIISSVNSGISQAKSAFANAGFRANVALTFTGNASGSIVKKPNAFTGKTPSGNRNTYTRENAAAGGKVKSAAGGVRSIAPGISLTGEEDPEIVWNKEQGYAYITGKNGPEFQNLQPGDRVFNADETKRILKRSKENKTFPSFGGGSRGGYNPEVLGAGTGSSSKTSGKTSTNSEKTSDEWKNELDWLYNLMEDIAESERTQEKLATKHERYLKDFSKNGKDLYEITKLQIKNLDQQYKYQQQALAGREREMQEQIGQSGYTDYVWWNNNDRTIEINWDKIEAIQDKDTYDKVSELVSKAEDIQNKIDSAEDALLDIRGQMQELQQRYIQEYIDFEQRALQAVVNKYQTNIDELSELNDTLNSSNEAILKSIRQEIDLQRKIRDNTEAEKEISDMEARLAYLRRDTTGANQSQILALEKQLEEKRQSYSDNLVDQAIDRISEDNDKAAEQREHQIDLMTKQLEYWQKSGELWEEVHALMEGSIGVGYLLTTSDLVELIKENEGFRGMSKVQQEEFIRELEESFKNVLAFEETEEHPIYDPEENYMEGILERIQKEGADVWNSQTFKDAVAKRNEKYISEGWGTQEDLDIENAALRRLSSTEWKPYKKVSFDPNANYMDIMQKAVDKYGAGAVNTDEWKNAVAARESKVYEQAKAKGEDPDAALRKARFEQAKLEETAARTGTPTTAKWNDSTNYKWEMIKIIGQKGEKALNDPRYQAYAASREQKIVDKGYGSRADAKRGQAEIDKLATKYGQILINKLIQQGHGENDIAKLLGLQEYAKGGLNTKTGLAWLDGTRSAPEYVLNARQTEAFLRLSEVLPSVFGTNGGTSNNIGGNVYLELTMNVGEISDDYDVDRLVDRVKEDIYEAAAYRNVNVISHSR